MLPRFLDARLREALKDTPAVFLAGARQSGKSTLAQALGAGGRSRRYLTMDDATTLAAARREPEGFLAGLHGEVVLDEVQRAPELFVPLKAAIDRDRRPGRFLLTGSASVLVLPRLADTLAGRMDVLTLWPFSQGELEGSPDRFLDWCLTSRAPGAGVEAVSRADLVERVVRGGYPEAQSRASADRRDAWFRSYVGTLLVREVRDLAAIEGVLELPRLLTMLVARTAGLVSFADLSRSSTLAQSTVKRYVALLEGLFLIRRLPPWSANATVRLVKAPKIHPTDTGLAAHLLGLDAVRLSSDPDRLGPLLEAFVVGELEKQAGWCGRGVRLFHFRTHAGREVDLIAEDAEGRCVAIEVKASATVGGADIAGIEAFRQAAGKRFHRGVVLYTGRETVPFSSDLHAMPVSALWRLRA